MPHPEIDNRSPFACELLFLTDEQGRGLAVPLVQATCAIVPGEALRLLDTQPPVLLAGAWHGDPATSSLRLEPQIAFIKLATDIVLLGHACPSNAPGTEGSVGLRVDKLQKIVKVFGNRRATKRLGFTSISDPEPFERIALTYENAFGGRDLRDRNASRHNAEPRNPVGRGYFDPALGAPDELLLPNLEEPTEPWRSFGDRPPAAGFGFIGPNWQPRARFAGTYDAAWNDTRKPLLPTDFDRRFFNAASPSLVAPDHLRGNEPVTVAGVHPSRVDFTLPGLLPPACRVHLRGSPSVILQTVLDTVVIDMDRLQLTLTWRAHCRVQRGLHDVVGLELPPAPPPVPDDED